MTEQATQIRVSQALACWSLPTSTNNGADNALDSLKQAKKAGEFYDDDAAVVRNSADGHLHTKETGDMTTGKGAGIGALIGGVVGILGGPAGVAAGAAAGAAIGAIAAHGDAGFDNKTLEEIGGALPVGSSAPHGHDQPGFCGSSTRVR